MRKHWVCIFHEYFALNVYKQINLDEYAVAVIKKGKVFKEWQNRESFFLRADTANSKEVKSLGNL